MSESVCSAWLTMTWKIALFPAAIYELRDWVCTAANLNVLPLFVRSRAVIHFPLQTNWARWWNIARRKNGRTTGCCCTHFQANAAHGFFCKKSECVQCMLSSTLVAYVSAVLCGSVSNQLMRFHIKARGLYAMFVNWKLRHAVNNVAGCVPGIQLWKVSQDFYWNN